MNIHQTKLDVVTSGRGLINITADINKEISAAKISQGLCNIFLQHTSASLIISENADPDVQTDLETFFKRLVPDGDPVFKHDAEGPDDMPSHIRSALTQNALSVPIVQGKLALGIWQGIFLWEHRYQPHQRHLTITVLGLK